MGLKLRLVERSRVNGGRRGRRDCCSFRDYLGASSLPPHRPYTATARRPSTIKLRRTPNNRLVNLPERNTSPQAGLPSLEAFFTPTTQSPRPAGCSSTSSPGEWRSSNGDTPSRWQYPEPSTSTLVGPELVNHQRLCSPSPTPVGAQPSSLPFQACTSSSSLEE